MIWGDTMNWSLFPIAINEYAKLGYTYIEVPWLINEESVMATLPPGCKAFTVNIDDEMKYLPGSAEQSFLCMALNNELPSGKYMAMSPCYRDDEVDELHQKYFMKLELIQIGKQPSIMTYHTMMNDARYVLSQFAKKAIVIQPTDTIYSSDLTLNGIEIGSYGQRSYKEIKWIYGTGLAEPRFSFANGV